MIRILSVLLCPGPMSNSCQISRLGPKISPQEWPCWRKCVTMGVGFEVSYIRLRLHQGQKLASSWLPTEEGLFLLPSDQDGELSAPSLAPCLPACHHVSCHNDNGLNLWSCKLLSIECFSFIEVSIVMVFLHSNETLAKTIFFMRASMWHSPRAMGNTSEVSRSCLESVSWE